MKFGAEARLRTKTAKQTEIDDENFGDQNGAFPPINLSTVSFPAMRYYDNH